MNTITSFSFGVVSALLISAAGFALAQPEEAPLSPNDAHPTAPTVRVLAHRCDKHGMGVDALLVAVDRPGTITLNWNNEDVCGKPA